MIVCQSKVKYKFFIWFVFMVGFLIGGCSSNSPKKETFSSAVLAEQKVRPLTTQVDVEGQYKIGLEVAQLKIDQKDFYGAKALLTRLRKYKPDDAQPYRLLREMYTKQADLKMAYLSAKAVLNRSSSSLKDEEDFARLALLMGHYKEADKIYLHWLEDTNIVSREVVALNNLGFSALLQKQFKKARKYFKEALLKDPLNEVARNNLKLIELN